MAANRQSFINKSTEEEDDVATALHFPAASRGSLSQVSLKDGEAAERVLLARRRFSASRTGKSLDQAVGMNPLSSGHAPIHPYTNPSPSAVQSSSGEGAQRQGSFSAASRKHSHSYARSGRVSSACQVPTAFPSSSSVTSGRTRQPELLVVQSSIEGGSSRGSISGMPPQSARTAGNDRFLRVRSHNLVHQPSNESYESSLSFTSNTSNFSGEHAETSVATHSTAGSGYETERSVSKHDSGTSSPTMKTANSKHAQLTPSTSSATTPADGGKQTAKAWQRALQSVKDWRRRSSTKKKVKDPQADVKEQEYLDPVYHTLKLAAKERYMTGSGSTRTEQH